MANVTMHGKPLTTVKNLVKEGEKAPDFSAVNTGLETVKFSSFFGKPILLISLPSLDTSVCSTEAGRFNRETESMSGRMFTIAISMDLPFAQKRWCGVENAKRIITLSDHRYREFGQTYGVLIEELGLLARAVFLIDEKEIIRKVHLIKEISNEPNYGEILAEAKEMIGA